MPQAKSYSEADRAEAVEAVRATGTLRAVARERGISPSLLCRWTREAGIVLRDDNRVYVRRQVEPRPPGTQYVRKKAQAAAAERHAIWLADVDAGMSYAEAGRKHGVSGVAVAYADKQRKAGGAS